MPKTKQNWGIALLSIFLWIGASVLIAGSLFAFILGSTVTSLGLSIGLPDFSTYIVPGAIFTLIFGIAYLFLGIFLWYHNKYAWWITFALLILSAISLVPGILLFSPILLISIILLIAEFLALLNKDAMQSVKVKVMGWPGWG